MYSNPNKVTFIHDSHVDLIVNNDGLPYDSYHEYERFHEKVSGITVRSDTWYFGEVAWFRFKFLKVKKVDTVSIPALDPRSVFGNKITVFNRKGAKEISVADIADHYVPGYMIIHVVPKKITVEWAMVDGVEVCRFSGGAFGCDLENAAFMKLKTNFYTVADLWFGEAWFNCNAVVYLARGLPWYALNQIPSSELEMMLMVTIPPYITHHILAYLARFVIRDVVKGFRRIGKTRVAIKVGDTDRYIETYVTVYRGRNRKYFVGLAHIISYIHHRKKESIKTG